MAQRLLVAEVGRLGTVSDEGRELFGRGLVPCGVPFSSVLERFAAWGAQNSSAYQWQYPNAPTGVMPSELTG
jgi:hypothetical protein